MKALKSFFGSPFKKVERRNSESPHTELYQTDQQRTSARRFSEPPPPAYGSLETNSPVPVLSSRKIDSTSGVESPLPPASNSLFEKSLKVVFPKQGTPSQHEATLRDASSDLTNIVNVRLFSILMFLSFSMSITSYYSRLIILYTINRSVSKTAKQLSYLTQSKHVNNK